MAITTQVDFAQNFPGYNLTQQQPEPNTFIVNAWYNPGSISFKVPYILARNSAASIAKTATFSLGLYSMNGSTLSLANSASFSFGNTSNDSGVAWYSLATSATQNITPGLWYWGYVMSLSNDTGGRLALYINDFMATNSGFQSSGGGTLYRAYDATTTGGLPVSRATSALSVEGQNIDTSFFYEPFIILTA